MESAFIWNILLTAALGLFGFIAKSIWSEMQRLSILVNRTREEMAKEYVTKAEVHTDINRVIDRIEALDQKIDHLIQSQIWDGQTERRSR